MIYKGLMEGWEPDECNGECGLCDECTKILEMKGDQEYEAYRYEQLEKFDRQYRD